MASSSILRTLLFAALVFFAPVAEAQNEISREQVLRALRLTRPSLPEQPEEALTAGGWEALAYLNQEVMNTSDGLEEAVPDVYRFEEGHFTVQLAATSGEGQELSGDYQLDEKGFIKLSKTGGKEVISTWRIWYLDSRYLVLEVEGLRLFLIRR